MKKIYMLLILFTGCVVASEGVDESEGVVIVDESPERPEGVWGSGNVNPDPCAPNIKVLEVDGEVFYIPIEVNCTPMEFPWDIYHEDPVDELSNPIQSEIIEQNQKDIEQ